MEEMQVFWALSFSFKVLKKVFLQVGKLAIFTRKQLDLQSDAVILMFYLVQNYIEEDFYQIHLLLIKSFENAYFCKGLC